MYWLQNKLKLEFTSGKKELGNFCEQYGVAPLRAPSNPKSKKAFSKGRKNYKKYKSYKDHKNDNSDFYQSKKKGKKAYKPYKKHHKKPTNQKEVKCYKCGKNGHYANKCKVEEKINQLRNLDISKELQDFLITSLQNILLNSEIEETQSSYDDSSEVDINQLDHSSSSQVDSEEECIGLDFCNCNICKTINVLTNTQANTLITILDKMEDSESKNAFMRQIKDIVMEDASTPIKQNKIEFKEIMGMFKPPAKAITTQDLQAEIKTLKQEINTLKNREEEFEVRLLELEGRMIIQQQNLETHKKILQNWRKWRKLYP